MITVFSLCKVRLLIHVYLITLEEAVTSSNIFKSPTFFVFRKDLFSLMGHFI